MLSSAKSAASQRWEIREWRAADADAWLACQRASFGESCAKSRADWQHGFDPGGLPTRGIVAVQDDRILAAYIGVPTRTWFAGEERICVQPVDLMLHPDMRRGLGAHRLHRAVAEAFFERYGTGAGDLMHYGWPVPAARRFGRRMLGYDFVREELCLVRDVPAQADDASEVQELREVGEDLRWLWDRCAGSFGLSTIRDAAWARWRFLEHPSVDYSLLGVKRDGVLRGLAVVRNSPWHWAGTLALVDWLVPDGEPQVALQLQAAVDDAARELGRARVATWIPESSVPFVRFQDQGWRVQTTPYQLLVKSFDRRLDADWVRQHAWLTLADSDLA